MKKLTLLMAVIMLSGCVFTKEVIKREEVETKILPRLEYVIKIPPADIVVIPPQVANINVDKAKQSDVAKWIAANEERANKLEATIISIMRYLRDEQTTLDDKARIENEKFGTSGTDKVVKPAVQVEKK